LEGELQLIEEKHRAKKCKFAESSEQFYEQLARVIYSQLLIYYVQSLWSTVLQPLNSLFTRTVWHQLQLQFVLFVKTPKCDVGCAFPVTEGRYGSYVGGR